MPIIDPRTALAVIAARHKTANAEWRQNLSSFAVHISQNSPRLEEWKPYKHVDFVARTIQDAIAKGGARIILSMPPRNGKSLLCAQYLPMWLFDRDPKSRIIYTSYEASVAQDWSRKVRDEIAVNPEIIPKVNPDVAGRGLWETLHGGAMYAVGTGGAITGRGGIVIIIDDPIKDWEDAHSPTKRLMRENWFDSVLMTRAEPGASVIVIMTRWAVDDLAGYLLEKIGGRWTYIRLPATAEENDPLGREIGDPLCRERFDLPALEEIKVDAGENKWAGMYQQRPSPVEGGIVKRHWWKFYSELPRPQDFKDSLCSWDMTFKLTTDGSFVCGGAIGRLNGKFLIMPKIVHNRMDFPESQRAVVALKSAYPWTAGTLVEDKANGPAILSSLKNVVPDLIPWQPQGKEAQVNAVSSMIEAGNVLLPNPVDFPESAEWVDGFIEEWSNFPNGKFDDQVDMGAQGLLKLKERSDTMQIFVGRA